MDDPHFCDGCGEAIPFGVNAWLVPIGEMTTLLQDGVELPVVQIICDACHAA